MHEETSRSLYMITDRLDLPTREDPAVLRDLDQMLARRADAIKDELREISQVRKRIESLLPPGAACGHARRPGAPGSPGASLGQTI